MSKMSKKIPVPDAWDDDWEAQADKVDAVAAHAAVVEEQVKTTKAERLARHAETNKKLWESAEKPETFHYLAAHDTVPLKQEFKPALKVLSRKPAPKIVQRVDPLTGLAKMTLDDDEEEEVQGKVQETEEERRLRMRRDQEEKQRRYEEVRARIMGTGSGTSTPRTATPPNEEGKGRGKGRNRDNRPENRRVEIQAGPKELFDPSYTPKPGVMIQKRNGGSGRSTPREEDQLIRTPRGPDANGRGGFANRNGKTS